MPDISMCLGRDCPRRDSCYRYTAKPSERQSYGPFDDDAEDGCGFYWPITPAREGAP